MDVRMFWRIITIPLLLLMMVLVIGWGVWTQKQITTILLLQFLMIVVCMETGMREVLVQKELLFHIQMALTYRGLRGAK
ncbi:MAG: hypothetical protein CMI60_20580 [Parvibaculum sp.]|nr:hypothetical protein [Parvibaculum sp.]